MYKLLFVLCCGFLQSHAQSNAVYGTDAITPSLINNESTTKRIIPNSKLLKNNLLNVIQQEFCFWVEPFYKKETDTAVVEKIMNYWSVLNLHPTAKQIQDSIWQDANPWSAAFISWTMKTAGYDSAFKFAKNHADYIVWAKQNREKNDTSAMFWAYNVKDKEAAWPKVGDLLCKNRSGKKYTLSSICSSCISHCDIIIETDYANGIIATIGGNVLDRVNKRWVFLDTNGFIDKNAKWLCFDTYGIAVTEKQEEFFAVIKTR